MALYKFKSSDIFYSRIKAHQKCEFFINDSNVHYNRRQHVSGSLTSSVPAVKPGDLSVFEYNIDRPGFGATPARQDLSDGEADPDTTTDGLEPRSPHGPGSEEDLLKRPVGAIRPFIIKGAYPGNLIKFKNISDVEYRTQFQ